MLIKFKKLCLFLLMMGATGQSFAQTLVMDIGSVTVDPALLASASCIQVPISFTHTGGSSLILESYQFTIKLSDPDGVIDGGIPANMIVANGFISGDNTGITNPGTDLDNNLSGTPTPSCTQIFNQATQGSGPAINFTTGDGNTVIASNNQSGMGWKRGTVINTGGSFTLGQIEPGETYLIGILEIPIIASPGTAQITIEATTDGEDPNGNAYVISNAPRIDELFDTSNALGLVNLFDAPDCVGATITDNNGGSKAGINYEDINAGGVGGDITFNIPSGSADQFRVTGDDGYDSGVMATTPGTSTLTIDTANDASPDDTVDSVAYTVVLETEFPPGSGTFVGGAPCNLNVSWAPATCTAVFDSVPVNGQPTNLDVTVVNGRFDGVDYGTVTVPGGGMVALTGPSRVNNVLTFDDAVMIASAGPGDVGSYDVDANGPGTSNDASCSALLTLDPPENQTDCNAITQATIGGSVDIDLQGNIGTIDFTVVYNGVTFDNLPAGMFTLPNINGLVTDVLIQANGFDAGGNPTSDDITCTLDFVAPTCMTENDPAGTVDVGTVVTIRVTTTGAIDVSGEVAPGLTLVSGTIGVDNVLVWEGTHTAVADTTLGVTVINPDGEETDCEWIIDINCIDPTIVSVAPVGDVGIVIAGTPDCEYTVRITDHHTGAVVDYVVLVGPDGTGTLNIVIPPDSWIEVGQLGFPSATDGVMTVPTLGEWGLIAFVLLLMAAAVFTMRKKRLA